MLSLILLSAVSFVTSSQNATFHVPFEVSFRGYNQFGFTIHHLDAFLETSSAFFGVDPANLTIAFMQEIEESDIQIVDVGLTVSVNSFPEKTRIESKTRDAYRAFLEANIPTNAIAGLEPKYESCPPSKYSTFYHFDIECLWLCDHDEVYLNDTNTCTSSANMTSTEWIQMEDHMVYFKFVGIGYVSSGGLTAIISLLFMLRTRIQKQREPQGQETLQSDTEMSPVSGRRIVGLGREDKREELALNSPMPSSKHCNDSKANPEDIQLVVGDKEDAVTPGDQGDEHEVFCLEEIECEEHLKEEKLKIINKTRRESAEMVEEFRRLSQQGLCGSDHKTKVKEHRHLERRLSEIKADAIKELRQLSPQ